MRRGDLILWILGLSSLLVLSESKRNSFQRRQDHINNWIRRIRSSKRGYSLSPSWNGKTPYDVISVASLPLQNEPGNHISGRRRQVRRKLQPALYEEKSSPNFEALNFNFGENDGKLTDFEGRPLTTQDFHPDIEDAPLEYHQSSPFPKEHEVPLDTHHQDSYYEQLSTNTPPFRREPSLSYRRPHEDEDLYRHHKRPDFRKYPKKPFSRRNKYRYDSNINYRAPVSQLSRPDTHEFHNRSPATSDLKHDGFFNTFDAFGPTPHRSDYNRLTERIQENYYEDNQEQKPSFHKPSLKKTIRKRYRPKKNKKNKRYHTETRNLHSERVLESEPKKQLEAPATLISIPETTATPSYIRSKTTTRPIPTPGPLDFPPPPPRRPVAPPTHPTHPPHITHPPSFYERDPIKHPESYFSANTFPDFDGFGRGFESMKVRNKRNSEDYMSSESTRYSTNGQNRRSFDFGTSFWDDANIEYDFFDGENAEENDPEPFQYQGQNSYRSHSVYPNSNTGYSKSFNVKKKNGYRYHNNNRLVTSQYSSAANNILGSGNFDIIKGGTFYDGNTYLSRAYSSRNKGQGTLFENFRDFADVKRDVRRY